MPDQINDVYCLSESWVANFIRRIKQNQITSVEARDELISVTNMLVDSCIKTRESK